MTSIKAHHLILLACHDSMLAVLLLEACTKIRSIIKVGLASLTRLQAIKSAMNVLEDTENNATLALKNLLLSPCEFLAHLTRSLKHFHCFPYVLHTCSFCLWTLKYACDSYLENLADEGTKKHTIAYRSLKV